MPDDVDDATLASRQAALQVEAGEVLAAMAEIDGLRDIGPLLPTGSYVSGLMTWRDLDVGALVGPGFTPSDVINVVARVIAAVQVTALTYRDERSSRSPTGDRRDERYHVPLQVVWNSVEWRFDLSLWLYDDHAHVADWHRQLGARISPPQRRTVLRIKDIWCRQPDYPDEVSGFEIYSAVLNDDVRTPDEFGVWLLDRAGAR
jgi:hypothetical protein